MRISLFYLIMHLFCCAGLVFSGRRWNISRPWLVVLTALFFISEPAVFLVWGPVRLYSVYAAALVIFLLLAKACDRFYVFLQGQEALVRWIFLAAVAVFAAAVTLSSVSEIGLRRQPLAFWVRECKLHPNAGNFNHLAAAYAAAKNLAAAQEYYEKAAAVDGRFIPAYQGLSRMAQEAGRWDEVIEASEKIIAINPHLSVPYLNLGKAYRKLGDKTDAIKTYSRLLDEFPDNENIDMKVIEAYGGAIADNPGDGLYKEKREEVLADFEQLSKRKHYTAADYYNLGFLYEQVGGKEEAMRFYAKAVSMKPHYTQALYNLANLYRDAGNYKIALILYGRLAHFHPKFAGAYLNMGTIFNALGDRPRALAFYLKVIQLDPDNGDAYFNLGYLSESQGELRDAINYYEKAVEVAPKNAEAYYNLGNVYASQGQNGEAIASYLKTVGLNPKHQDAFVNLSILSFKSHDFQGAIHYLEDAQALGYNPPVGYLKTLAPYRR